MIFFENLRVELDNSSGWIKILIVGLFVALGLAGFFGWRTVKDLNNMYNAPKEELINTAKEAIDTSKEQLEKQSSVLLDEGKQKLDDGKQTLDEAKEQLHKKVTSILDTFKK